MHKIIKNKTFKLIGLILLVIGIIAGILLVKQSQDIREKASGADCSPNAIDGEINCYNLNTHCDGTCYKGICQGLAGLCGQTLAPTEILVECKPPRHLQNGRCIGNPGGGLNLDKCEKDDDCKSGQFCAFGRRCIPDRFKINF